MENILFKYMSERFNTANIENVPAISNLPFITISREFGCSAKEISELLAQKMNKKMEGKNDVQYWRVINKEIIFEASNELKVDPNRIKKFFTTENRTAIDEILNSLSEKYYHSDKAIQRTLSSIVADFARKGNAIIVGRGGVCVTHNFLNGLHIRLTAPLEWRIEQIAKKTNCTTVNAKKIALEIDLKRAELLKIMSNNCFNDSFFDITYNCQSFSKEEIVASIIYHLDLRNNR